MTPAILSEKRRIVVLIPFLGVLSGIGPITNDLFVPSLPAVAGGLGAGLGTVQLTMTAVMIGFAVGQLIYGPLSDRYGRRPLLCLGLLIYVIAGFVCANASDLQDLIIGRALQGLGGSAGIVLARAIVVDQWRGSDVSRMLSWVTAIGFTAPVLSPLGGGYIASVGHWPLAFWLQAGLGGLCLVAALALLSKGRAPGARSSVAESFLSYMGVLRDREALGHIACMIAAHAGVIAFVTNSSIVFIDHLGLEPFQYGYCFAFVMLGGSMTSYINGRLVSDVGISRLLSLGTAIIALAGVSGLLVNLFQGGVWALLLPCFCYITGFGFIAANATARALSRFPDRAGAAASVLGFIQFSAGAMTAALLSLSQASSAIPLASALALAGSASAAIWWGWLRRRTAGVE